MAIGSLIAFAALLAGVALLIARPWERDAVPPSLSVDPNVGVAVGNSLAIARPGGPSVADATVARGPAVAAALDVAAPGAGGGSSSRSSSDAATAADLSSATVVAAAPVTAPAPGRSREAPTAQQPAAIPVSASPPAEPAPPVVVAESDSGRRPASAGRVPPTTAGLPGRGGESGQAGATFELREGGEYHLSFWFEVEGLAWAQPGTENLLVRVLGEPGAAPSLGLQLWELPDELWYEAIGRGLWASGEAMGAERLLASLDEGQWHRLALDLATSSRGDGGYALYLDGVEVDARTQVSLIEPGGTGELGVGLFREGRPVVGSSEVRIDDPTLVELSQPVPGAP